MIEQGTINLDMDHFIDVYGERPSSADYRKKWDNKALSYGGGSAPGSKKEVIELRLTIKGQIKNRTTEQFFESYTKLHQEMLKYELTALDRAAFMIWLNTTEDKEVSFSPDHTILHYTITEYQYEKAHKYSLPKEIDYDSLVLPRGEQNK